MYAGRISNRSLGILWIELSDLVAVDVADMFKVHAAVITMIQEVHHNYVYYTFHGNVLKRIARSSRFLCYRHIL